MKMFTKEQKNKMIENFKLANSDNQGDLKPVVKLFGGSSCTWLLVDLDLKTNTAFGLCDLGFGFPELGSVSIEELNDIRFPPFGLPIERDLHFKANKSIAEYNNQAYKIGYIQA